MSEDTQEVAVEEHEAQEIDPNGAASNADGASPVAPMACADAAPSTAGTLLSTANSTDEPLTFEQLVEKRFLEVEQFLLKLPRSMMHALSEGSGTPDEVAQRATAHLLDKNK